MRALVSSAALGPLHLDNRVPLADIPALVLPALG